VFGVRDGDDWEYGLKIESLSRDARPDLRRALSSSEGSEVFGVRDGDDLK
jgi:hypothetical protein